MSVLFVVLAVSIVAGLVAYLLIRRFPQGEPILANEMRVVEPPHDRGPVRAFLTARLDPAVATGLVLTVAFIGLVLAGVIVGVSVWMIRREAGIVRFDHAVERWAEQRSNPFSDDVLVAITHLGDTATVVVVGVAVACYGLWRWRRWSILLFLLVVVAGQSLIANSIKYAVERSRPELRPRAHFTGTSFPSGHTTAAAATYVAVMLVIGIGASPKARATLLGVGVAIGVAVGSTRALLGVHWFSDVLAGLAVGWAWFGLCAVAFGGFMRSGAPAQTADAAPVRQPSMSEAGSESQR